MLGVEEQLWRRENAPRFVDEERVLGEERVAESARENRERAPNTNKKRQRPPAREPRGDPGAGRLAAHATDATITRRLPDGSRNNSGSETVATRTSIDAPATARASAASLSRDASH